MRRFITDDFMGYLKDQSMELKKIKILEIYRHLYRFSLEKVKQFIDNPAFIIICLQYLKMTRMERIHQREVLSRYCDKNYRALENMINNSEFKDCILSKRQDGQTGAIDFCLKEEDYNLVYKISAEKNQVERILCLKELEQGNYGLNLQLQQHDQNLQYTVDQMKW